MVDAGDAQAQRLLKIEHREAVGRAKRARRALEAVAVGVRLDHRPDLRPARRAAARLSRLCASAAAEIVARIGRGMKAYCAIKRRGARRAGGADKAARLNYGFYIIMAAQFFSSLADNALLVAAIALLIQAEAPSWLTPYLKFFFVISYVVLAPFVGAFADRLPKGQVMFIANTIKIVGCVMMLFGVDPLLAYAIVGLGAAAYSPAKYGILTEYLPHSPAGGRQRLDRGPHGGLDHPRHRARRAPDPRAHLGRAAALRHAADRHRRSTRRPRPRSRSSSWSTRSRRCSTSRCRAPACR